MFRSSFTPVACLLAVLQLCGASTPDNNENVKFSDGFHIYGGDIILSREQEEELSVFQSAGQVGVRHSRSVVMVTTRKWPGGIVPYRMSTSLNNKAKEAIEAAMQQIKRDTDLCVNFRAAGSTDDDYVLFIHGNGCYANVGRQGGQQNVSIGTSCESTGLVMHEILHVLGRWHEQSRPDRDSYVTINTQNIEDGLQDNFKIVQDNFTSTQGLPYDYDSVMHYDAYAFSSNGEPTITPVDNSVSLERLGQRRILSDTDIEHIKVLYCPNGRSEWTRWSSWSQCSKSCGTGMRSRSRTCIEKNGPCSGSRTEEELCKEEECPTSVPELKGWGDWSAWSGCSHSCGKGQKSRIRKCLLPSHPSACQGSKIEVGDCNIQPCRERSEWSPWLPWSSCSPTSKGTGMQHRTRLCKTSDTKVQIKEEECPGVAKETRLCTVNISCTTVFSDLPRCEGCSIDTCLSGLRLLGCRRLALDQLEATEVVPVDLNNNTGSDEAMADKHLEFCGKAALTRGYNAFGLNRSYCIVGMNASSSFKMQVCRNEGTNPVIDFYEISNRETFELSVSAYHSCGAAFCHELISTVSSATKLQFHLFFLFSIFMWSLW